MSCNKWSYTPEKCDGDFCVGDCDCCHKSEIDEYNENMMTYNEIIDGLEMMDFFADRAGKELWFDKPTDIQNQDIAKHHSILQSAIKNLKEQQASKWIKCSDKMPPQYETVICYSKLNGIMLGMWEEANIPDSKEKGIWFMADGVQSEKVATHWMSFPNPPDEN